MLSVRIESKLGLEPTDHPTASAPASHRRRAARYGKHVRLRAHLWALAMKARPPRRRCLPSRLAALDARPMLPRRSLVSVRPPRAHRTEPARPPHPPAARTFRRTSRRFLASFRIQARFTPTLPLSLPNGRARIGPAPLKRRVRPSCLWWQRGQSVTSGGRSQASRRIGCRVCRHTGAAAYTGAAERDGVLTAR